MKIFEYGKNNDRYWDKAKLYYQALKKVLPITKILYFRYSHLFLFKNVVNNSVYVKDTIYVKDINKDIGSKESQLRNGWYNLNRSCTIQSMSFQDEKRKCIQKDVQYILENK